jgi:hypothetical protein
VHLSTVSQPREFRTEDSAAVKTSSYLVEDYTSDSRMLEHGTGTIARCDISISEKLKG